MKGEFHPADEVGVCNYHCGQTASLRGGRFQPTLSLAGPPVPWGVRGNTCSSLAPESISRRKPSCFRIERLWPASQLPYAGQPPYRCHI